MNFFLQFFKRNKLQKKSQLPQDEAIEGAEEEGLTPRQIRSYILSSVALALAVGICLIVSVQVAVRGYVNIAGYSIFRVVTGSMEPTIPTGAILVCHRTSIEDIAEDDIVCYRTQVREIYGSIVTHRVVSVGKDENGTISLETRGDANLSSDAYYVNSGNLIGRVVWYMGKESFLTNILSFISGKTGFLAVIVFPILLVAGFVMQRAVENLRKDLSLAKYELERGPIEEAPQPPPAEELIPGYTLITKRDYAVSYRKIQKELLEELGHEVKPTDSKTK